jgi:hypothetical protein
MNVDEKFLALLPLPDIQEFCEHVGIPVSRKCLNVGILNKNINPPLSLFHCLENRYIGRFSGISSQQKSSPNKIAISQMSYYCFQAAASTYPL